ncbi:MAG: Zn-ribbon domain-containing OB-fold protein [Anaerolineae bacterium]
MEIPRHWRLNNQRYALVGEVCDRCGAKLFPPRDVCPECGRPAATPYTFSGRGEVYSYSTIYQAPEGFEEFVPYTVALVKLEEGPLVTAQLTDVDSEEVQIGMPVEMVTRKIREEGEDGLILYGYKFRPVLKGVAEPQQKSQVA